MKTKSSIIKEIDACIGSVLVRMPSRPDRAKSELHDIHFRRVLVIRPGGIGDAALLIPAIQFLKMCFPHVVIDILAEMRNAAVFSLCPDAGRVRQYDRPGDLLSAIWGDYDLVIDTEQWHRLSAVVARLVGAPVSIGYATNERKKMFTDPILYSQDDHEVISFLNLITPIADDWTFVSKTPFLTVPEPSSSAIKRRLHGFGNRMIVALFPGGSINERKWGSVRFHHTAKLLGAQGYSIVIVGGKDDVSAGEEIVSGLSGAVNLRGKLSLPETAAVLKESALLITGDSGIMHIGYGLGIKVLALFGPGREKKWAPRGKNCRVINKHLPCSPCTTFGYTPKCRKNAACMSAITVEEVIREALALLEA